MDILEPDSDSFVVPCLLERLLSHGEIVWHLLLSFRDITLNLPVRFRIPNSEMRGARFVASWAPGVATRPVAQPNKSILGELYSGAHRPTLPAFSVAVQNGLNRLYSGTSGPARNSQNCSLRHSFGSMPYIYYKGMENIGFTSRVTDQVRHLSSTRRSLQSKPADTGKPDTNNQYAHDKDEDEADKGFELSERAAQAAQVNLRARLAKDGAGGKSSGFREIWRLLMIARPEARKLGLAFLFLLISSSITMSIPFSIGKIMDTATKSKEEGGNELFGLSLPMFYSALAGILAMGAAANYGRIIILRIVGERIVARLRSRLFRQTFVQDAEFFDANRVGDLISRLSSDTIIVGKSITQNLSDGLRAGVSGAAGFGLMAYTSLKLSSILALLLPPIGLGAFFYGRAIRNLSRQIQRNLGSLTKIAEERLGNVKTSQSFAGEILEVNRYNKQVRKIFDLGRKESLISATFFSSVSETLVDILLLSLY